MKFSNVAKGLGGALAAGLLVFDMACEVKSAGGVGVTSYEWVRVAASAAIAGLAVYSVPNTAETPEAPRLF